MNESLPIDLILASAEQFFKDISSSVHALHLLVQPSRWEEDQRDTVHTPVYARRVPPCHQHERIGSHNFAGVSSEHNGSKYIAALPILFAFCVSWVELKLCALLAENSLFLKT